MPKSWEQMVHEHRGATARRDASAEPTVRWGDERVLEIGAVGSLVTGDLLNVELPRPEVCTMWFHGEVISGAGGILATSLELFTGNGSQTTRIRRAYPGLPAQGPIIDVPIDVTWQIPLASVRGRVSLLGQDVAVRYALWMTPLVGGEV